MSKSRFNRFDTGGHSRSLFKSSRSSRGKIIKCSPRVHPKKQEQSVYPVKSAFQIKLEASLKAKSDAVAAENAARLPSRQPPKKKMTKLARAARKVKKAKAVRKRKLNAAMTRIARRSALS